MWGSAHHPFIPLTHAFPDRRFRLFSASVPVYLHCIRATLQQVCVRACAYYSREHGHLHGFVRFISFAHTACIQYLHNASHHVLSYMSVSYSRFDFFFLVRRTINQSVIGGVCPCFEFASWNLTSSDMMLPGILKPGLWAWRF